MGELRQWQHLQEVPHYQSLLTADLAQGVCTSFDGCALTPVPGAPSYTLSNLEANALQALTPAWAEHLEGIFWWGGLVFAWLSPVGFILMWRSRNDAKPTPSPGVFPLNIHASSVNTPTLAPSVVTTDLRSISTTGPTQQTLNDRHAEARPGPNGSLLHDGGCRDLGSAEHVKNVMTVIPGPSKRPSLPI